MSDQEQTYDIVYAEELVGRRMLGANVIQGKSLFAVRAYVDGEFHFSPINTPDGKCPASKELVYFVYTAMMHRLGEMLLEEKQPVKREEIKSDLPEGWSSSVDPETGNTYYVSPEGASQWENP